MARGAAAAADAVAVGDAAGFATLLELFAAAGDSGQEPIPVAIKTSRGLLVACLRATGRDVFAINPLAVSLYRDRHSVARKKSDAGDALVLAHILRTDQSAHRALPADSELAQAVAVLACAQEDAVWDRTCAHNKLRSLLREYYPGNHRGVRRQTPRPAPLGRPRRPRRRSYPRAAARLSKTQLRALLRRAGRQRASTPKPTGSRRCSAPSTYINPRWSRTRWAVKRSRCSAQLDTACVNADELAAAVIEQFEAHPNAAIIASQPGLGALTGACVLAEIGDDRSAWLTPARSRPTPALHP